MEARFSERFSVVLSPPAEDCQRLTAETTGIPDDLESSEPLPAYSRAVGSRNLSYVGLALSITVGVLFLALGTLPRGFKDRRLLRPAASHVAPLVANLLILVVTESLGYIHSISLRWALFRDNRLNFNSNSRFLTFARSGITNGPVWNALYMVCISGSFAASGYLLLPNPYAFALDGNNTTPRKITDAVSLTRSAPIIIGVSMLLECALAFWTVWTQWLPSWSNDALNSSKIAMSSGFRLEREDGRCMMSVHDRRKLSIPQEPLSHQQSANAARRGVKGVLYYQIVLTTILLAGLSAAAPLAVQSGKGDNWSFIPTTALNTQFRLPPGYPRQTLTLFAIDLTSTTGERPAFVADGTVTAFLFLTIIIESLFTIGIYTAELPVNLYRDERQWRRLATKSGTMPSSEYNALLALFSSMPGLILLLAKPILHWLFSSAFTIDYAHGFIIRIPQFVYFTVAWTIFVGFVVYISFWRPRGPLPATFGHLQTIINCVDSWEETMYWGSKGIKDSGNLRHAGTSYRPLPDVKMDSLYS